MTATAVESWTHHEGIVNGVRLHWVEEGAGPLVVLLHGFPEFWYSWRHQIPALAEHFRVVALDMRGYNLSEKPPTGYDTETLCADVLALIHALGEERAHIAGHDWGGVIAWTFAILHPEAADKLVAINAPHPARFRQAVRRPRQFMRSTYVLFFQLPWLPEALLGANRGWAIGRGLQRSAVCKEAFSDEDLALYREAMTRPGTLTAAINYYRAAVRGRPPPVGDEMVLAPTLLLWGVHDQALGKELAEGLERWVPDLTVRYLECGHWTQQERPEEVNRELLEFLNRGPLRGPPDSAAL